MDANGIEVDYWDNAYADGMYADAEPDPLVGEILATAAPGTSGVEIGCGNGRNLVPLIRGGLDLIGVDPSRTALAQLAARAPDVALVHGTQDDLPAGRRYDLVIGIQVHQHGTRAAARALLRGSLARVAPGGLFVLRTASADTEAVEAHEVLDVTKDGGHTFRYLEGFKAGLIVHYYGRLELENLLRDFEPVVPLRVHHTPRLDPPPGVWAHWETIVRRPG
ncbi:class I SAM-dependent methyltransferase [Embleya sp. NBC_00896]|uniref:class I SAM-dependent methyltransferase n=1 Tax=Embleya sp. NBC_00896 TaxID=2975961 RepID=UPI003864E1D2|nr:class I SAM-dependent methyltransferase [Embleya sp. NBC_00896]